MHCSDEELLAHFDGELSMLANRRVRRHVETCWRCRTRLASLQEEVRRLLVQTDEWRFPPPEWHGNAWRRLTARLQDCESHIIERKERVFGGLRGAVWISAVVVLIAIVAISYFPPRATPNVSLPNRPLAADVIAQAVKTERVKYAQPVHQTFSLRIAEIRPSAKAVDTQLQVWADNDAGKFAYRLSGPGGALRHALWRPGANQEFVYRPGASSSMVQHQDHRTETVSLASLAEKGLDPTQIESAFMGWMENRPWIPLALSADLSLWMAMDGSVAQAERIIPSDGAPSIRLTVQRRMRKVVAILTVDLDSNNFLPRVQTIRFETPERAVEFRLEAVNIQTMNRSELVPAVFRPDPDLEPGPIAGAAVMLRRPTDSGPDKKAPGEGLRAWDLDEVRARYALHQAGACLGESVRISEESSGVSILRRGSAGAYLSEAKLDVVLSALSELRDASPPRDGGRLLRHAWALKHLASELHSRTLSGLANAPLDMIDSMVRDHVAGVRNGLEDLTPTPPAASGHRAKRADWKSSASSLFQVVSQLDKQVGRESSAEAQAALISTAYDRLEEFNRSIAEDIARGRQTSR